MVRVAMSPAAAALLRALIARAGVSRDRILLTDIRSVDWRSLTFTGERHQIALRIPGPEASAIADRLGADLAEAEFAIAGVTVADIAIAEAPAVTRDGAVTLAIEALTISED